MNKLIFSSAIIALIGLNSCEKCATCTCVSEVSFEFDSEIPAATQVTLESTYKNAYNEDYPERNEEICEKRKDFDATISSFESESTSFVDNNVSGGYPWSFSADYSCTCIE